MVRVGVMVRLDGEGFGGRVAVGGDGEARQRRIWGGRGDGKGWGNGEAQCSAALDDEYKMWFGGF